MAMGKTASLRRVCGCRTQNPEPPLFSSRGLAATHGRVVARKSAVNALPVPLPAQKLRGTASKACSSGISDLERGLSAHDTRFRYLAAAAEPLRPLRWLPPQKPAARPPPNPARSPPASSRRTSGGTETQHPQAVRTSSPARRAAFQVHHAVSPPAINARRPRRSSSVSADRSGRVSSSTCFSSFSGAYFSMSWISLK